MKVDRFEAVLADSKASQSLHYQLRYKVFCMDTGYEDPYAFDNAEEKDEWDRYAAHFLILDREMDEWVATARIILPAERPLPIEVRADIDATHAPRPGPHAEVSRLCFVGYHRPRLQGRGMSDAVPGGVTEQVQQRRAAGNWARSTDIMRTLLRAGVGYSREAGINNWYCLTSRAVSRILTRVLAASVRRVGPVCWYRGERYPYTVDLSAAADKLGCLNTPAEGLAYNRFSERFGELKECA